MFWGSPFPCLPSCFPVFLLGVGVLINICAITPEGRRKSIGRKINYEIMSFSSPFYRIVDVSGKD